MGSVVVIFFLPIFFLVSVFNSIAGAITGTDKTKVELPYDEESGLIWECEEDASWFSVSDVRIEGDKQIFTFKGVSVFGGDQTADELAEVRFNAENSQSLLYYAVADDEYNALNYRVLLYSPDEYDVVTYTLEASRPVEEGGWVIIDRSLSNNEDLYIADDKTQYNFVCLPDKDGGERVFYHRMNYFCGDEHGHLPGCGCEYIVLKIVFKDGEARIEEETRQYYDDEYYGWSDNIPVA